MRLDRRPEQAASQCFLRASRRVMPLRDPAGTVYGYVVRGLRGRMPLGPYRTAEEALNAALDLSERRYGC